MTRAVLVLIAIVMTVGCSLKATFLPGGGPLSQVKPVPLIQAKASGVLGHAGGVSFAMPDGEKCEGRWSSTGGAQVGFVSGSLISQYGATHLSGFSLSESGGMNRGYAIATCSQGRTFEIEFVSRGHGFGIAKDSEGNIYRFVF